MNLILQYKISLHACVKCLFSTISIYLFFNAQYLFFMKYFVLSIFFNNTVLHCPPYICLHFRYFIRRNTVFSFFSQILKSNLNQIDFILFNLDAYIITFHNLLTWLSWHDNKFVRLELFLGRFRCISIATIRKLILYKWNVHQSF